MLKAALCCCVCNRGQNSHSS